MSATIRPTLWYSLKQNYDAYIKYRLRKLAENKKKRFFILATYLISGFLVTYSILHTVYALNIKLNLILYLPFSDFYTTQLIPFLAKPMKWIGFDLNNLYNTALAISAVGATIWARSEFENDKFLILFFFPKVQRRPGYIDLDLTSWETPPDLSPKKIPFWLKILKMILRAIYTFFLMYLLLGIIALVLGLPYTLRHSFKYIHEFLRYCLIQLTTIILYLIWGFENDKQSKWKPNLFYFFYNMRKRNSDKLQKSLSNPFAYPVSEFGTIRPIIEIYYANRAA